MIDAVVASAPAGFRDAVTVGFGADRVATAFLAGYRAAVRALIDARGGPALAVSARPALAATEDGPLHPAKVRTTAVPQADGGWRIDGRKGFVTGHDADVLVVLAVVPGGDRLDRLELVAVVAPVEAPGVTVTRMPALPFVPEVGHAEVVFDGVAVAGNARLPGDGWADVVRPFRTVEDVHVLGAIAAYLAGAGLRDGWPEPVVERLVAGVAVLGGLAGSDPSAPGVHLALAGAIDQLRALVDAAPWAADGAGGDEGARWRRDAALLRVADRARTARTRSAWDRARR